MRCFTVEGGRVTGGIRLWQDGPNKCFVHVRPNIWLPVHKDLLAVNDPLHVARAGSGIVLHRASVRGSDRGIEFVPETVDSAQRACVLVHVAGEVVSFTVACPEPAVPYRSVMGMNFCCAQVMGSARITPNSASPREEYAFAAGMAAGDDVRLHVMFYGQEADSRQIEPWVEGSFLRYDGQEVTFHPLMARPQSERFKRRRAA